ncbi:hypothetical protein EAS61_39400 [Bradyrhizobium zhanjiangense]|uniref:Uncharacterized protein n=1 Tax=Bradyrhizobium zhanjiangense TaxID=1325107 RepID=A0A4Q0Q5P8_9BRAD|nr:hypothetical protein EAS61_39400 [Bradyrhizobium zhanjiangense]
MKQSGILAAFDAARLRQDCGLVETIARIRVSRRTESGLTHTLAGEWRAHPGFSSAPSALDLKTWREVARNKLAGSSVLQ